MNLETTAVGLPRGNVRLVVSFELGKDIVKMDGKGCVGRVSGRHSRGTPGRRRRRRQHVEMCALRERGNSGAISFITTLWVAIEFGCEQPRCRPFKGVEHSMVDVLLYAEIDGELS